jgi:hypothetical protein
MKLFVICALALLLGSSFFSSGAVAACNHPYYPSAPKTTWVFENSGFSSSQYTQRILSGDASGFTVENDFGKLKIQNTIDCAADGSLVQTRYATLSGAKWVVGGRWTYSYKVKITSSMSGQNMAQNGTVSIESTILKEESVKVPAGTFTALKVSQKIVLNLTMVLSGKTTPINTTNTSTSWFAKGVGLVQSVTVVGKQTSTSQLVSFTKP